MEEQLERQRAADHFLAPRTVVGPVRRPVSPVGGRAREACLDVVSAAERPSGSWCAPHRAISAEPDSSASKRPTMDWSSSCASPASHEQTASASRPARRDRDATRGCSSRGGARAVVERRRDAPTHGNPSGYAVDSPDQLSRRPQLRVRQGHRVGDPDHPLRGRERRLEDVGVGQVAAPRLGGYLGAQLEAVPRDRRRERRRTRWANRGPAGTASRSTRPVPPARRSARRRSRRSHRSARSLARGGPASRQTAAARASLTGARDIDPRVPAMASAPYASRTGCRMISVGRSA